MEYLTDTRSNPFGFKAPCDRFVPGYGDVNADFHVIGDNPAVHGGLDTGIPFTGRSWSATFFDALTQGELVTAYDDRKLNCPGTFFSYLCLCDPPTDDGEAAYEECEPYFDSELRAITAHVLLPVSERPITHVLETYTSMPTDDPVETLHATVRKGSGWLVIPVADPATWSPADATALVETLRELKATDYRQLSDLGRFFPDENPYFVR